MSSPTSYAAHLQVKPKFISAAYKAPGNENVPPEGAVLYFPELDTDIARDPHQELLDILYDFDSEDPNAHVIATIDVMLGLPAVLFRMCYPGKASTITNECPFCGINLR